MQQRDGELLKFLAVLSVEEPETMSDALRFACNLDDYALLDLHDLEDIQAYAVEAGAEYTIRDYTVSIYKDKETGGLSVEVTGHLFETEKPMA